jgi:hypothetical protein
VNSRYQSKIDLDNNNIPYKIQKNMIQCVICGYTSTEESLKDSSMHDMGDGTFQCSSCWIGKQE